MSNGEATDGNVRPMASLLADRASAGAILIAGLVTMVGFVPLSAGLIAAFMDGHMTTAFVPVGGTITLIGALGCVGAFFFRRAHVRALATYRGAAPRSPNGGVTMTNPRADGQDVGPVTHTEPEATNETRKRS